jgi:ubiquinone/menaquinone biosynthesis C-methylase UbiE
MDNPLLKAADLAPVFQDLNRTNRLLGGQRLTLNAVRKTIGQNPSETYTIVDMGCGDGDLLRRLALRCRNEPWNVSLVGIDNSPAALEVARQKSASFPEIRFVRKNILDMDFENHSCDILLCTLTLHHFSNGDIASLLGGFLCMTPMSSSIDWANGTGPNLRDPTVLNNCRFSISSIRS